MAKLTKTTVFKPEVPRSGTPIDKTTRIVKKIVDEESEKRHAKIDRLRKARLESEANSPTEAIAVVRKTRPSKVVTNQ